MGKKSVMPSQISLVDFARLWWFSATGAGKHPK
jgi:hypothetical protein